MSKTRADQLMVEKGLVETRAHARALIMAGKALADGVPVTKAGQLLKTDVALELKDQSDYVSRGGYKLEGALDDLDIAVEGLIVLDVGASTGGFTDCLLRRGAASVTAVDVGYGLLHWRLRQDPRVIVLERVNARYLTLEQTGRIFDLAVIDVSFISLTAILPAVKGLLRPGGRILALVKPQFELGRVKVSRGAGVVRDEADQLEAVENVKAAAAELGLNPTAAVPARLKGPKGNQEYLLFLVKPD